MAKDMTTGSPLKLLLLFTVPLLIGNIFQQFYNMVDTIIVGRYVGPQALAAVGSTGALSFFIIGFAGGLMGGFSILISQSYGAMQTDDAPDDREIRHIVAISIELTAVIALVVAVSMIFLTRPLLKLMQTPADILDGAQTYIGTVFVGAGTALFYNLSASVMRAVGDSKTPLVLLIISSFFNIGMDLVFVIVFDLGIFGVAAATVSAQAISALLGMLCLFIRYPFLRPRREQWKPDKRLVLNLLRLGIPNAFMNSVTAVGHMVLQSVVNTFGSAIVAAHTAASRVEQLAQLPGATLGTAMATYSGQNCGAGKLHRVKEGVLKATVLTVCINLTAGVLILCFGPFFTRLFVDTADAALLEQIVHYSRYYQVAAACTLWVLGLLYLYRNALQGMGNPMIPFWSGILELIARCGISVLWADFFGYAGVCWGAPAAWVCAAALLIWGFFRHYNRLCPKI